MGKTVVIKKIFYAVLSAGVLTTFFYLIGVYKNNETIADLKELELQDHLEKSIVWLVNNKQKITSESNVMLWWMLYEAYELGGDKRLFELLDLFYQKNNSVRRGLWKPLFGGPKKSYISSSGLDGFPYYNIHFIYALNCALNLEYEIPIVDQQNKSNFCYQSSYIYRPACITHQLMGLNFLKVQSCDGVDKVDEVISDLQNAIVSQLTWDIRVVDVYLQRVMMLLITGQVDKVKPVWIKQILDHQLADGGWGDFDALVNFGGTKSLGFGSKIISLGSEKSSFHATAQGVYLLTMLTNAR